jgi:hypothetical protein
MKLDLATPITNVSGNKILSPTVDRSKFEEGQEIDPDELPSSDLYTYGDVIEQALTVFKPEDKNEQLLVSALAGKIIGEDEIELNDDLHSRLENVLEEATQNKNDDMGLRWWITAPLLEELNNDD